MKQRFYRKYILFIVSIVQTQFVTSDQIHEPNYISVSGYTFLKKLPLSQLLKLQKSVCDLSSSLVHARNESSTIIESRRGYHALPTEDNSLGVITALPLTDGFSRKAAVEPWDTKPSKIQSIFQLSVTALAFLAFASYLLCMIVQAIKSKGTTYFHPNVTSSATMSSSVKKRKPLGRRRRYVENYNITTTIDQSLTAGPDPESLYLSLISVSETFVKFTIAEK